MNITAKGLSTGAIYPPVPKSVEPEPATVTQQVGAARTDRLELSPARAVQKDSPEARLAQYQQVRDEMLRQVAQSEAECEAKAKEAKMRLICLKIAMRIMAGDKVPPEDEKYLLENDPKLYMVAVNMRQQKEDPEEHESLLEEDEDEEGAQSVDGVSQPDIGASAPVSESAAPVEAAPAEAAPE